MSTLVVDCSVTMAWCFDDESDRCTDTVLDALAEDETIAPSLWPLDVANVLALAERHKRLTVAKTTRFFQCLRDLPIHIDEETTHRVFHGILSFARAQGLSAYDAAYLELAARRCAPLATQDRALRRAANKLGVALFARHARQRTGCVIGT